MTLDEAASALSEFAGCSTLYDLRAAASGDSSRVRKYGILPLGDTLTERLASIREQVEALGA